METIRYRKKTDKNFLFGTVTQGEKVCIDFEHKTVEIWNGAYWKKYDFSEFRTISIWDAEEGDLE